MNEWTVVTVIVTLVGLGATVLVPVLKLNSTITKLSTLIDGALQDMKKLEAEDEAIRKHAAESHRRIHNRIDDNEEKLQDHETRIVRLETKKEETS